MAPVSRTLAWSQTDHEKTGAKIAITLRKVFGRESMGNHPFGLQDSWILIADYCASNCGKWIKSSLQLTYEGGYTVTSSGLSEGTLRILALTILPYLSPTPKLLCVEKPETHIHPKAMEIVLQSLSSMYNSQVWISTHSPIALAHTDLKSVIVMHGSHEGNAVAIPGLEHPRLQDWQGSIDLGSLFAAGVLE
jgi:hypothetical protein